jgi:Asp-tRNA(Asn)/Glu-tRNA(Gln) amidotransferase C subunit
MAHPFESHNRLDDDVPEAPLAIEAVLMNAPAVEGRYLAVPKVLAEES